MYKFRQLIATIVFTLTIAAPLATHAGADFKWWATGQTSGQINLTNASGVQRQNLPSNPTGAQAVRSANTQAPTVIVQATQSLPVKNIGDTCTQTTSGTAPNQSAAEGTAITADRIMLLTCNAATGVWLPARVYANEGDACNVIYKTTSYAVGDRLVLAAALPSGTIASNSAGLTLSCQSGVWRSPTIGSGQTWKLVAKTVGTTYTNTDSKPIIVAPQAIAGGAQSYCVLLVYVNGLLVSYNNTGGLNYSQVLQPHVIVPPGSTYMAQTTQCWLNAWNELS